MHVSLGLDASDPIGVRFRPDLRTDDGGVMFIDIANVSFLMPGPRARALRDALTAALDAPDDSPADGGAS